MAEVSKERNYFEEPMTLAEAEKLEFKEITMTREEAIEKRRQIDELCDAWDKASFRYGIPDIIINI